MPDYTEVVTTFLSKIQAGHTTKHKRPSARPSGKKKRKRPIAESKLIYERSARGRRVMEIQVADRERDLWDQRVFEEDENGQWKLINHDTGSLHEKGKRRKGE